MGLLSALRWHVEGFTKRSCIETTLDVPREFPKLGPELETAIFKIVQESLTNVFRHAEARKAKVKVEEQDGRVYVCIADNGKGIARRLEELQAGSYGIGIIGIKQRVEELGGQLAFRKTAPGTTMEVTIPAKNARGQSAVGRL